MSEVPEDINHRVSLMMAELLNVLDNAIKTTHIIEKTPFQDLTPETWANVVAAQDANRGLFVIIRDSIPMAIENFDSQTVEVHIQGEAP